MAALQETVPPLIPSSQREHFLLPAPLESHAFPVDLLDLHFLNDFPFLERLAVDQNRGFARRSIIDSLQLDIAKPRRGRSTADRGICLKRRDVGVGESRRE